MVTIAICDDDKSIVERIDTFIQAYSVMNNVNFQINHFYSGEEFWAAYNRFDLIFLDVEMPNIGGIDIANQLRKNNDNAAIVYVTNYPDYWKRAYKVHAFDYICKPFNADDIYQVLTDFLNYKLNCSQEKVILKFQNGIVIENANTILYFYLTDRNCIQVVTQYKSLFIKESLSHIMSMLDKKMFFRTHKNSIVNMRYVQSIEKDNGIIMTDGSWVPLALKKQNEFLVALTRELRGEQY